MLIFARAFVTASVRSRSLDQPLVTGVYFSSFLLFLLPTSSAFHPLRGYSQSLNFAIYAGGGGGGGSVSCDDNKATWPVFYFLDKVCVCPAELLFDTILEETALSPLLSVFF